MTDRFAGLVPKNLGAVIATAFSLLLLQGCATKELREARAECQPEAYRSYPVDSYQTLVTKTRTVRVPTGETNCTTSYFGTTANTSCQQVMRNDYQTYQEVETVDRNEQQRKALIQSCARDLCMNRYGNPKCE